MGETDGRIVSGEAMRKVRTPQGSAVVNGDHGRSDSFGETGQQKAFLSKYFRVLRVRLKRSDKKPTRFAVTQSAATLARCKTKQKTMTRPAEFSGWLLRFRGTGIVTQRAIVAAEK